MKTTTYEEPELGARIALKPMTARTYMAYTDAYFKHKEDIGVRPGQQALAVYLATLDALLVEGTYEEDGQPRDLKEAGLDAPRWVVGWVAYCVDSAANPDSYMNRTVFVPKASAPPPPAPEPDAGLFLPNSGSSGGSSDGARKRAASEAASSPSP